MIPATRSAERSIRRKGTRLGSVALIGVALLVVTTACADRVVLTPSAASGSPSASTAAAASPSPAGSPVASAASASPPAPSATSSPTQVPSVVAAPSPIPTPCPVKAARFAPPTDRLVDVTADTVGDQDVLVFHFGNMSVPGPGGPPKGEFGVAEPPYTEGPSGLPIEMAGDRVVQLVLRGMSLQSDTMEPVYGGPREIVPDLAALKHAVEFDESEGVIGWYVGFDGPGCVSISRDGNELIVAVDRG